MLIQSEIGLENRIQEIVKAALRAVDPYQIVKENIEVRKTSIEIGKVCFQTDKLDRILLFGLGKASLSMARGAYERLGDRISEGVLVTKHISTSEKKNFPDIIKIFTGDHPIPTINSVKAAKRIIETLSSKNERDLVLGLISGGGSSLAALPKEPVEIKNLNELTKRLLFSGASIHEINSIRKHLDQVKGGGLLQFIQPARSINLILSDVIGDDLSVIASGPTSPDPSTFKDAVDILNKYKLWEEAGKEIHRVLSSGMKGEIPETVKRNDPILEKTNNQIIGSLSIAAKGAKLKAESLGFHSHIYDLKIQGEARQIGRNLARYLKKQSLATDLSGKPLCLIAGGETTVTVTGKGKGGRNLELALGAAMELAGSENLRILTLATDGEDGPTDAAGAFVDGQTILRAKQKGMDAEKNLSENNSYSFFERTGELVKTGPTGTNVNDLVFLFTSP